MAMHLNSDNFNQVISKGKVMVDFWAPWCMPCQSLLPVIDELSGELEGKAVVAKVNVDENKPIAREYGVMSIPTVVFFVDVSTFPTQKMSKRVSGASKNRNLTT